MDRPPPVRCTGRALDKDGRPDGDECGRTFTGKPRNVVAGGGDPRFDAWGTRPPTAAEQDAEARGHGWRLGPVQPDGGRHAMCPRCAKPDATTAAICRELDRSTK